MDYKSPKLTTDGVIVKENQILFIKRGKNPFKGCWALPGGFVEYGEKIENAVVREILEETGLRTKIMNLVGVYSDPDRDPRGHTVSVVYFLDIIDGGLVSGDDACDVGFFNFDDLPVLAFDHDVIVKDFLRRFR